MNILFRKSELFAPMLKIPHYLVKVEIINSMVWLSYKVFMDTCIEELISGIYQVITIRPSDREYWETSIFIIYFICFLINLDVGICKISLSCLLNTLYCIQLYLNF